MTFSDYMGLGRSPGLRDHGSFQPYPWQTQAWNFLSSSNIWLDHILQIGIRICDEAERQKRGENIRAYALDSRDTGTQKNNLKVFTEVSILSILLTRGQLLPNV